MEGRIVKFFFSGHTKSDFDRDRAKCLFLLREGMDKVGGGRSAREG